MGLSHHLINAVKDFEGFRSVPYLCPTGYPTIGYGHVIRPAEVGTLVVTEDEATKILVDDLTTSRSEACALLDGIDAYPHRLDAMTSWVMNLGAENLRRSTLRRKYNAGDTDGAALEIVRWVHGHINGVKTVLRGLVRRREWEQRVFTHGIY